MAYIGRDQQFEELALKSFRWLDKALAIAGRAAFRLWSICLLMGENKAIHRRSR